MTESDKEFLISFKAREPKWDLLPFDHIRHMPAIKWKLYNISQMDKVKHQASLKALESKLINGN